MTTLFKKAGGRWFAYIANGAKIQQKMGNLRTYPARQRLDDGPNADRVGTDYLFETLPITKNSKLTLKMANGRGFVIGIN
jgi:hypothetical protein